MNGQAPPGARTLEDVEGGDVVGAVRGMERRSRGKMMLQGLLGIGRRSGRRKIG